MLLAVALTALPDRLRNGLIDARFQAQSRAASGSIVLVAIDSPSIEKMGAWPWPRYLHANLIDKLTDAGAAEIFFDVDFSSPSDGSSDRTFAEALQRAGGSVVLPSFKQVVTRAGANSVHVNRPLPEFGRLSWPAVVNVAIEPDGLARRYLFGETLDGVYTPSMSAVLAGRYEQTAASFWIDFSIRPETIPTVSYFDVLRADPATLARLKDKKILIGATAIELGDRFSTPNGKVISGPALQILAAESILQGRALSMLQEWTRYVVPALIALIMIGMWRRTSAVWRFTALAAMAVSVEIVAFVLQDRYPVLAGTSLAHITIVAYCAVIALDEINLLGLLSRIAEHRFQQIAMALGDGLVCTDSEGRIQVWNRGAAAIFGYTASQMMGRKIDDLWTTSGAAAAQARSIILDLPREVLQSPGGKLMEIEGRRKNGETFALEACFSGWNGADGFQYGVILRDISVRKRDAERIRHLAEFDTLTGLANRNALHASISQKIAENRGQNDGVALLVIGIANFRHINDVHGHAFGDQLLCAAAQRIVSIAGSTGEVARLSSDEFAIVLSGADIRHQADNLSLRLRLAFMDNPLSVGPRQQRITINIGGAIHEPGEDGTDELLGNAHLALTRARTERKNGRAFYHPDIRAQLQSRLQLEADLAVAIERGQFELFYQPQFSLAEHKLTGAEALIRWRHPERGLVRPDEFIPIINETATSEKVGAWVLETACRQGRRWQEMGHNLCIGMNLSPLQLQQSNFAARMEDLARQTGFSPSLIKLEVTENILLAEDDRTTETFRRLRAAGIRIALDDFGTGYASLSYLKKFPIDTLKIDKSFVLELKDNPDDAAIVTSTIALCWHMGISVIAEGIEDAATAELLTKLGCHEGQGYYFGKPVPAADFERMFFTGHEASLVPEIVPATVTT
jgi:diguanylate cyclase (GGDEF)-like protein/PAS domain S-box-containing protein